jgi:hypothetical protein
LGVATAWINSPFTLIYNFLTRETSFYRLAGVFYITAAYLRRNQKRQRTHRVGIDHEEGAFGRRMREMKSLTQVPMSAEEGGA